MIFFVAFCFISFSILWLYGWTI